MTKEEKMQEIIAEQGIDPEQYKKVVAEQEAKEKEANTPWSDKWNKKFEASNDSEQTAMIAGLGIDVRDQFPPSLDPVKQAKHEAAQEAWENSPVSWVKGMSPEEQKKKHVHLSYEDKIFADAAVAMQKGEEVQEKETQTYYDAATGQKLSRIKPKQEIREGNFTKKSTIEVLDVKAPKQRAYGDTPHEIIINQ